MRRWARQALGVGFCCGVAMLVLPALASATDHRYCNSAVPAHTACSTTSTGVYYENVAHYPGTGTVSVCVHDYLSQTGSSIIKLCQATTADDYPALSSYYDNGFAVQLVAGNDSDYLHTIWGTGTY